MSDKEYEEYERYVEKRIEIEEEEFERQKDNARILSRVALVVSSVAVVVNAVLFYLTLSR